MLTASPWLIILFSNYRYTKHTQLKSCEVHILCTMKDTCIAEGLEEGIKNKCLLCRVNKSGSETNRAQFQGMAFCTKIHFVHYLWGMGINFKTVNVIQGKFLRTMKFKRRYAVSVKVNLRRFTRCSFQPRF